jgi:hypothetical protein
MAVIQTAKRRETAKQQRIWGRKESIDLLNCCLHTKPKRSSAACTLLWLFLLFLLFDSPTLTTDLRIFSSCTGLTVCAEYRSKKHGRSTQEESKVQGRSLMFLFFSLVAFCVCAHVSDVDSRRCCHGICAVHGKSIECSAGSPSVILEERR